MVKGPGERRSDQPMDGATYERAVRDHLYDRLLEEGMQDANFRLEEVSLQGGYPRTRLVVTFKRDDFPRKKLAYWVPLWEIVAWTELHVVIPGAPSIYSQPQRLASDFLFEMFHELDNLDLISHESGTRSIRQAADTVDLDVPEDVVPIRGLVSW